MTRRGGGIWGGLALATAMAVVMTACSSSASSSSGTGSANNSSTTKKLTIGVVELDDSQTFGATQHPALQQALEARGWSVSFIDSKGSPANAVTAMQNLIQKGVNVLVVQTYAANELTVGLAEAKAKHIPVFSTGGGEVQGSEAGAVQFINAEPINQATIGLLKQDKSVALLQLGYTPGAPCLARAQNLNAGLTSMSTVSSTDRQLVFPGADQSGQTSTTGWLEANPSSSGKSLAVWLCTSDAVAGVIAAEKQLHRGPYPLYTWDLSAPALAGIASGYVTGDLYMPAVPSSDQLAQMIAAEQSAGSTWKPETVAAQSVIVTKANLAQYKNAS